MVALLETADATEKIGFGTSQLRAGYTTIAREHGMPIDTLERPRMAASLPACRAIVAARLHAPEQMRPFLRALRVRSFAGALLDDPELIASAAGDAGLDANTLDTWAHGTHVSIATEEDTARARSPSPAARVLDHKLAAWEGGRRTPARVTRSRAQSDGMQFAAPGFQPLLSYETILANLLPDVVRRAEPNGVQDVLEWAGMPLASAVGFAGDRRGLARLGRFHGSRSQDPRAPIKRRNERTPAGAGVLSMELGGLEPPTSWVRSRRSPN
jgi:hypothetical protein